MYNTDTKVLISDFDGTLARVSPNSKMSDIVDRFPHFVYYIMMIILGLGYPFRLSNKKVLSFVKNHKGKVIIHSSVKDILPSRIAIKVWLLIHRVRYDKLILRKHGESKEHFKYINIVNERGSFVLENEPKTISYIEGRLGSMKVHFQERGCQVLENPQTKEYM